MPHAHDRYFRIGLQAPAEQAAMVASLFPDLGPLLDTAGFETVDGTFVDEHLHARQTDVLLRTRLAGHEAFVYVVIEHQRTVDPFMALRMMRYQARIWDRYLRENPDAQRLPVILPAVVYQGQRPWNAPTNLRDLLHLDLDPDALAAIADYLPSLRYRLDDLTLLDPEDLTGRPLTPPLRVMLTLLMAAPGNTHVDDIVESLFGDVAAVAHGPGGAQHITAALTYIASVANTPFDRLGPIVERLGSVVKEAYMTTADLLRAEGQAELLLRQLTRKFGPLDNSVHDRVHAATTTELETWADRVLTATTLDDVLA